MHYLWRLEEGIRFPGTGVIESWQPPCGYWVLNLNSLEEQPGLLTAKQSLQLPQTFFRSFGYFLGVRVFCSLHILYTNTLSDIFPKHFLLYSGLHFHLTIVQRLFSFMKCHSSVVGLISRTTRILFIKSWMCLYVEVCSLLCPMVISGVRPSIILRSLGIEWYGEKDLVLFLCMFIFNFHSTTCQRCCLFSNIACVCQKSGS